MRVLTTMFVITLGLAVLAPMLGSQLLGGQDLASSADAAPQGKKIVTINLVRAIAEHPRTKVVEDNMRKAKAAAEAAQKREFESFNKLKAELDAMGPTEPKREFTEKKLLQLRNNMKFNAEWAEVVATRTYVRDLEQIYKAVHGIVGQVARDGGHEIVLLRTDPNEKLNSTNGDDLALKTRLRVVVFADDSCDITQAVIDKIKKSN